MPIGHIYEGDNKQSELDRYGSQLEDVMSRMPNGADDANYRRLLMKNRHWTENFYKAAGKGILKATESTINFPFDLAGAEKRFATFSDYIADNPDSTLFQIVEDVSQLGTGLITGGALIKGAKSLKNNKEAIEELRRAQLRDAGVRGGSKRLGAKMWDTAKRGAFHGAVAEMLAFRGQDEALLLSAFFDKHPDYKTAFDQVTSQEGWENNTVEENGYSFQAALKNIKGRAAFAGEGAIIGALANFLMAGAGAAWRAAKGEGKGAVESAARGTDTIGDDAAQKTADKADGVDEIDDASLKASQEDKANEALSKARDDLHEAELDARAAMEDGQPKVRDDDSTATRNTDLMPEEADDFLRPEATTSKGINKDVYTQEPIARDTPISVKTQVLKGGARTAFENNTVLLNKNKAVSEFNLSSPNAEKFTGDNGFNAKDIFDTADDYQRFLIEKEKARQFFPRLKKESKKAYEARVEKHAINESKRLGLGNWYKYEFRAPAKLSHLKLNDDELKLLFKEDHAEGAKTLVDMLRGTFKDSAGKTVRFTPEEILAQASKVMRLDTSFTDNGMQYFQGRFMHLFMDSYKQNFEKISDADTFAKAVGYVNQPKDMSLDDMLRNHMFDSIDDLAASTGLSSRSAMHRITKGRGAFDQIFDSMDMSRMANLDTEVMKEMNARIMAYRLTQAIGMKNYRDLAKKIANSTMEDLKTTPDGQQLVKEYMIEMEKQAARIEQMQKLRRASGKVLRSWRDFNDVGLTGIEGGKLLAEKGGLGNLKKHAQRTDAIFDAADNQLDGATAASDYLVKTTNWIDVHNEYWLNSLLSGTKTQVVNMLSTGMHMYYKPLEGIIGSLGDPQARRGFTKALVQTAMINVQVAKVIAKLGANKLKRMSRLVDENQYLQDRGDIFAGGSGVATDSYQQALGAVAGARKAMRTGDATLTRGADLFDVTPANVIGGDLLSEGASQMAKDTLDHIGNIIRLPSRLMITGDELFKQISFRSAAMGRLAADAYEVAIERGLKSSEIDSDYISKYVADHFNGMIRSSGRRYSPKALKEEGRAAYKQRSEEAREGMEPFEVSEDEFVEAYAKRHQNQQLGRTSDMAMDYAEDVTFTRSLDADLKALQDDEFLGNIAEDGFTPIRVSKSRRSFLADTQDMVNAHPWMRILMPFIRTPVNIIKWPIARLGSVVGADGKVLGHEVEWLKHLHLRYQADMASGDPLRAAAARGRIMTGRFYWAGFVSAAMTGTITGAGPSNPREKRNLMATGWRPYSVRVGDKYISYSRLDPFSGVLGLAADVYEKFEYLGRHGDVDDSWVQAIMMSGAYSLSNNIADKSYLAGINNVLQALIDPEHQFESLVKKQTTSYLPKIISQWTPITDDNYIKKSYGLMEGVLQRTPFANSYIEPMRNYLGEPLEAMYAPTVWASGINPFMVSKDKNDRILDELVALQYGFGAPSPRIKGNKYLDMRKYRNPKTGRSAFDRYQELVGEVKSQTGGTLRDALTDLFNTRFYRNATILANRGSLEFKGTHRDPRIKAVKSVMSKWRSAAKAQVLREYPDLLKAVQSFDQSVNNQLLKIVEM